MKLKPDNWKDDMKEVNLDGATVAQEGIGEAMRRGKIPGWTRSDGFGIIDCHGAVVPTFGVPMCGAGVKSGQWCEDCEEFVGRWLSCRRVKVYCRACMEKRTKKQ